MPCGVLEPSNDVDRPRQRSRMVSAVTVAVAGRRPSRGSVPFRGVVVLALLALTPGAARSSGVSPGPSSPPAPAVRAVHYPAPIGANLVHSFGVAVPGLPTDLSALNAFEGMVGRKVSIVSYYQDFASGPDFDARSATAIWDAGATPMLAWEPEDGAGPVTKQPGYSLASIINGAHDALIGRWATEIAGWGKPILLRFAPEMNGNWNPWSPGVNGNLAGQYVLAWRHVHDVFARAGATNVIWVWDPMVDFTGSTPLAALYPGDAYVDVVGLDGYNWGTSQSWSDWQSPAQIFAATLTDVRKLTTRPILLCEVGSSEDGGNKAAWINQFFAFLSATPAIEGFVWFEFNKETDWRVESSTSSKQAFIADLSNSNFR